MDGFIVQLLLIVVTATCSMALSNCSSKGLTDGDTNGSVDAVLFGEVGVFSIVFEINDSSVSITILGLTLCIFCVFTFKALLIVPGSAPTVVAAEAATQAKAVRPELEGPSNKLISGSLQAYEKSNKKKQNSFHKI